MRSRILPWTGFLAAHLLVAVLGWVLPARPMGDVEQVYWSWSANALAGTSVVGLTETWVYPQLALPPMLLAQVIAVPFTAVLDVQSAYPIGWALLVTACDAAAFALLLAPGTVGRRRAAWFWTGALVLLGPIALYRIDAITVPVAIAGALLLSRRPAVAAALFTVGMWIKIWPGALLLAAAVAVRARGRVIAVAMAVSAGITGVLLVLGAGRELFGFLGEQTGRGLQIEAVAATPYLWLVVAGRATIDYSFEILTFQVHGEGVSAVAAALTPLMVAAVLAIALLGALRARDGASWRRLLPPFVLALTVALVVTNKVGSPQFQTWLIAAVVVWLVHDAERAGTAVMITLLLCALTFAVYPLTYDALIAAHPIPVLLLTVRNLLLVVLLVHAVHALWRVPVRSARTLEV